MTAPLEESTRVRRWMAWLRQGAVHGGSELGRFFREQDPTVGRAFVPAAVVAALLFVRSPATNYIFDEQEALLANPFVNGKVPWREVLARDFWGLPHDRSIGSYRPLPDVIWRALWQCGRLLQHPWALHWVNVGIHALNAASVARLVLGLTRDRRTAWLSGAAFVTSAVLTEAVTGVVGLADVLGALGLLLALLALEARLPLMAGGVFLSVTLGFFSKESTLVALPIVAWAALLSAPLHHPARPLRALRALAALVGAALALALYTETRRRFFPTELPAELQAPLASTEPLVQRALHAFLRWFQQPRLPQDPINNPLVNADTAHRIAGALGVTASGAGHLLVPWTLSGDYSHAAEPIPDRLVTVRSVVGALVFVLPPLASVGLWLSALRARAGGPSRTRLTLAIALLWVPVAYFPHSNIPISLPTVRAERFWYLPAAGAALALGIGLAALLRRPQLLGVRGLGPGLVVGFLGFHAVRARTHALDYTNDLTFWRATARAVPNSAKAHLNYGVMLGARGHLVERLVENRRARELAPTWPMAHIYYADTLCRLGRTDEAWPEYRTGMVLGPNDRNLIALALQCLWDHQAVAARHEELSKLAEQTPGTWLAFLARDLMDNGPKNGGVDKQYRPRGYDEGPKE